MSAKSHSPWLWDELWPAVLPKRTQAAQDAFFTLAKRTQGGAGLYRSFVGATDASPSHAGMRNEGRGARQCLAPTDQKTFQ